MQRNMDADRAVLAPGDVAELPHRARVAERAEAIGSGQWENPPADQLAPMFSTKLWRGSDEIVTGMPSRVASASRWTRLCHSACSRGSGA
jgi:hypothetical protein